MNIADMPVEKQSKLAWPGVFAAAAMAVEYAGGDAGNIASQIQTELFASGGIRPDYADYVTRRAFELVGSDYAEFLSKGFN